MTTLALNHLLRGAPSWLYKLGDLFHALFAGLDEARATAQRFESLSRMTDVELARHGLKREDLPRAAFGAGQLS